MIVFTVTNTLSQQIYVGTTRDCPQQRWAQLCAAANEGQDGDLYSDIRHCGEAQFVVREWAFADSLPELRQLAEEAIIEHQAISLQGLRTRPERAAMLKASRTNCRSEPTPRPSASSAPARQSQTASRSQTSSQPQTRAQTTRQSSRPANDKLPSGRVGSSAKEKKLREAIEQQRQVRLAEERNRQQEQADEMAAIMARIDSRSRR